MSNANLNILEPVYLKDKDKVMVQYNRLESIVNNKQHSKATKCMERFDYNSKNQDNIRFNVILDDKDKIQNFVDSIIMTEIFNNNTVRIKFQLNWNEDMTSIVQFDDLKELIDKKLTIIKYNKHGNVGKEYCYQIKDILELDILLNDFNDIGSYEARAVFKVIAK